MATPINQPPPVKTNYLPWILGGCGVLLVFWIVVVIAAFGIYYYLGPTNQDGRSSRGLSGSVKPVDKHGVQTVAKTWSSCNAFAPADWAIVGNEQRLGIGTDLASADQT